MIEDKKLPKPTNNPDMIPEIKAEMLINKQTGAIKKLKPEYNDNTIFPHTTYPSMGSGITPHYIQGNVECEIIKSKIRDMQKFGEPSLLQLEQVFYNDKFPKNTRFQCTDCPQMPPFEYIVDMVRHGVRLHFRPLGGVLSFLMNVMEQIERR